MALELFTVRPISRRHAMEIVVREHYLHRACPCSAAFGLFLGDTITGVVCYGTPSSAPLRSGVAGPEYSSNVVELTRLWVSDSVPKNGESMLIGRTLRHSGKEIVVSFAEIAQGHVGTVYQATNWIYTGLSAKRTNWTISDDGDDSVSALPGLEVGVRQRHCQTLADRHTAAEIRAAYGDRFSLQDRPRKHRYIYLNAKGKRRKELLAALRYPILPYPKTDALTEAERLTD